MTTHADAPAFPVTWKDPADANLTWFRDPMHFPGTATPLTGGFLRECLEPGVAAACATLVSPLLTLRHTAFNGWVYNSPVLAVAPEPGRGRRLSAAQIAAALRRGGRRRGIAERALEIQAALRAPELAAVPSVADAHGLTVRALVNVIAALP